MKLHHVAVCVNTRHGRAGFVVSAETSSKAVEFAERSTDRIGYVGGDSFLVAVRRAGMMERNEAGAWGPLPEVN